jgi:hypothetical protein
MPWTLQSELRAKSGSRRRRRVPGASSPDHVAWQWRGHCGRWTTRAGPRGGRRRRACSCDCGTEGSSFASRPTFDQLFVPATSPRMSDPSPPPVHGGTSSPLQITSTPEPPLSSTSLLAVRGLVPEADANHALFRQPQCTENTICRRPPPRKASRYGLKSSWRHVPSNHPKSFFKHTRRNHVRRSTTCEPATSVRSGIAPSGACR